MLDVVDVVVVALYAVRVDPKLMDRRRTDTGSADHCDVVVVVRSAIEAVEDSADGTIVIRGAAVVVVAAFTAVVVDRRRVSPLVDLAVEVHLRLFTQRFLGRRRDARSRCCCRRRRRLRRRRRC